MAIEGSLIDFGDELANQSSQQSPGSNSSSKSSKFEDNFWGQECRGFETLLNNLKVGSSTSHHLSEYIKERIILEKTYVKGLQKLSKSLGQVNDSTLGSYHPLWLIMLKTLDTVNNKKEKHISALADLGKEINEYTNKLDEELKGKIKGEIISAHKSLTAYRHSAESVRKTRKHYHNSCSEVAELQKEMERARLDPNRSKELEKMEVKIKKGRTNVETCKTEHQKAITSYHGQWSDFEGKMTLACKKFQTLEEEHLNILRKFTLQCTSCHERHGMEVYTEFKKLKEHIEEGLSVDKLISIFTNLKKTGTRKPELVQFTEIAIDSQLLPNSGSLASINSITKGGATSSPHNAKKLKVKKTKENKKTATKKPPSGTTPKDSPVGGAAPPTSPIKDENVDEEGFTIRPKDADKITKFSDESSNDSDSSDSDSDIEAVTEKRIHALTIKDQPVAPTTTSVDELSKVAKLLKLEAPAGSPNLKRAGSTQSLDVPPTSISNLQVRQPSPVGSQSLYNQPIDHTPLPPPSPTYHNITAPPILSASSLGLPPPLSSDWANFSTSFTAPPTTLDTTPPFAAFANFTTGNETTSMDTPSPISSLLPPPPSSRSFVKSEPSSPMSSIKGLAPPTSSLTPTQTRSPRTISVGNVSDSPRGSMSPLATMKQSATSLVNNATPPDAKVGVVSNNATPPVSDVKVGVVVPLAVAFMETCNAIYKGSDLSKTIVKVSGQMDFSFPSSYITNLQSHPPLKFSLTNTQNVSKILLNQNLMTQESEGTYIFQMPKLYSHLKQLADKNVSPFHNVQALKYEVDITKSSGLPLQMTSFWKCDSSSTSFRLDYTYTPNVFPLASKPSLSGLTVSVTIGGGVNNVANSQPKGAWSADKNVMMWRLPDVPGSEDSDTKTIKSKFDVQSGPSTPTPALVQFMCDGSTLSGINMTLGSPHYKVSLHKEKCISGKYMAEPIK